MLKIALTKMVRIAITNAIPAKITPVMKVTLISFHASFGETVF